MTVTATGAISKPQVAETKRIRLTSRVLHIGSAVQKLNPFEYVQTGQFVYLPDSEVLSRELRKRGFLNDYIYTIEERKPITQLLKNALGEDWETAKGEDGQAIFPRSLRSLKWAQGTITDLRPMIRDGFGRPYIPGSSIKGAMRTAIAYHLLKNADRYRVAKDNRASAIEKQLRSSMGDLKRKARFTDDSLFMDELFSNFGLSFQEREVKARQGPNTDFMRAIQVSDSQPLVERRVQREGKRPVFFNLPVATETLVSSRWPDYKAKYRASIYAEMLFNVNAQFEVSIDREMLSWFSHNNGMKLPFHTVDELLAICRDFAQDQWDFEHDYWAEIRTNTDRGQNLDFSDIKDLYEPETCPYALRLGWGSGLRGTTISLLMRDELVAEVRDTCGLKAPGFEAPKSRRTVKGPKGEIRFAPGWIDFKGV
ncbi:MAG: type III-A CRISPR-associated RAMP protein Csm5 [Cyanobacteria bacterium P01_G01_bin.4]